MREALYKTSKIELKNIFALQQRSLGILGKLLDGCNTKK